MDQTYISFWFLNITYFFATDPHTLKNPLTICEEFLSLDQCCVNTHLERKVFRMRSSQSLSCSSSSLDTKTIDKSSNTTVMSDILGTEISIFT
jgi:hypothetical protein